jgi:hypothetical protein
MKKIFISQTKGKSREIAEILQDWLRTEMRLGDPWTSEDIPGGRDFREAIKESLKEACFGILCITAENQTNQWISYEAGALTDRGVTVVPYILDLDKRSNLPPPINNLQAVRVDRKGTRSLVEEINKAFGCPVNHSILMKTFDEKWPEFEKRLNKINQPKKTIADYEKAIDDFIKIVIGINEYRKKLDYSPFVDEAIKLSINQKYDREVFVDYVYNAVEDVRESLISENMPLINESLIINIRNFFKESFTKDDLRSIITKLEPVLFTVSTPDIRDDLLTLVKVEELEVYLRLHQKLAEKMQEDILLSSRTLHNPAI